MPHVTPEMRRSIVMAKKAGKKTKLYGSGIKEHIIQEKKVLEINQEDYIILRKERLNLAIRTLP